MSQLFVFILLFMKCWVVFGKMPTAYDCDILRQHGILTPKCKARYIVHEGREPLVLSNDDQSNVIKFKSARRAPLPMIRKATKVIESSECKSYDTDGNWMANFLNSLYRSFVVCDALKLKLQKPLPIKSIVHDQEKSLKTIINSENVRRSPIRYKPKIQAKMNEPKKSILNRRYQNVETIKWRDPLEEFHSIEEQKRLLKKLQVQPKTLNRSKFYSRKIV